MALVSKRIAAFVGAIHQAALDESIEAEALAARVFELRESVVRRNRLVRNILKLAAIDMPAAEAVLDSEVPDVAYSLHESEPGRGDLVEVDGDGLRRPLNQSEEWSVVGDEVSW